MKLHIIYKLPFTIGPLVYINPDPTVNPNKLATLVGIMSWQPGCADLEYPTVFARVTTALQWIKDTTGDIKLNLAIHYTKLKSPIKC